MRWSSGFIDIYEIHRKSTVNGVPSCERKIKGLREEDPSVLHVFPSFRLRPLVTGFYGPPVRVPDVPSPRPRSVWRGIRHEAPACGRGSYDIDTPAHGRSKWLSFGRLPSCVPGTVSARRVHESWTGTPVHTACGFECDLPVPSGPGWLWRPRPYTKMSLVFRVEGTHESVK